MKHSLEYYCESARELASIGTTWKAAGLMERGNSAACKLEKGRNRLAANLRFVRVSQPAYRIAFSAAYVAASN
jgi:hypothetical protein